MKYLITGGAGFIGSNIVKELLKKGEQARVFDNFATGKRENLLSCEICAAAGNACNIACGKRYTILQLVDTINRILGKNIEPVFEKGRVGDVKHSLAGIEKAKRSLGFSVICGFEEGLKRLIENYQ